MYSHSVLYITLKGQYLHERMVKLLTARRWSKVLFLPLSSRGCSISSYRHEYICAQRATIIFSVISITQNTPPEGRQQEKRLERATHGAREITCSADAPRMWPETSGLRICIQPHSGCSVYQPPRSVINFCLFISDRVLEWPYFILP